MEKIATVTRKRSTRPERISLNENELKRVDGWLTQIRNASLGVKINRNQLVQWLIGSLPETFSEEQLGNLKETFFNEVYFVKKALLQLQESQKRGEKATIEEIIQREHSQSKKDQF